MNLILNGILVFILNVLLCTALYDDNIGFNPYIIKYDKVNYDRNHLIEKHFRVKRFLEKHIYFSFKSHGRDFKLKLNALNRHSYANKLVEVNGIDNQIDVDDYLNFYEGVLVDEPDTSFVSGSIIDGIFFGTIKSGKHGKFFIEPSKRYNHTLGSHSIIYNENDINFNTKNIDKAKSSKNKRSIYHNSNHTDNNDLLSCASSRKKVKEWMEKEQEALYRERIRTEGYDPYSYIDKEEKGEHKYNKYSREANEPNGKKNFKKRDIDEAKREEFPQKRTICNLYLRVDPQLHNEIFNNEGNRDNDKTTTFLLFYLNKHVEALNTIYNSLAFYDSTKDKYYIGLQFMIYRTKIITEEQCKNKTILSAEELKLCEPYLDVSTFLNYVSLDNFTDYCLSYTFTARDFTDGTLGLAWVAKLAGSVGGVCERRQILQGVAKSLNSGIVTVVNYQARVPEAVSQITFAHEVGHNFGSEHDPDDSTCSPGTVKGGNFIMYRRATTGTDKNNRNFSQCSRDQMGPIVHALVDNKNKFCFKQFSGSLCGNGIVEEGEECDCGYGTDCKESCCIDASQDTNKCKLKPGKQCSPSQGPCCDFLTCSFASSKTICMQSNECLNNVTCTGKAAACPRFDVKYFKPDKTECNSGTQVCKSGICSGSICEKYEMKQCFLEGNLKDKNQDKAVLCHLACTGEKTGDQCVDSFQILEMVNPNTSKGLILKPGSPCIGTLGYCDIFSKCRSVDGEGPLARLKNFLLNPVTLSSIRDWITTYWWAATLIFIGLIAFMVAFIKVCSVHTPSSNPRKPPALKITETLRRPIKKIPHPHINLHLGHHGNQAVSKQSQFTSINQASKPPTSKSGNNRTQQQSAHLVNERHGKSSSRQRGDSSENHRHQAGKSTSANHKSHHSNLKSKSPNILQISADSNKAKSTNLFSKRHKSNDQLHYYNQNHPLHPIPHHNNQNHNKSSSGQHHSSNKASSSSDSRNRSKSLDEKLNNQHNRNHNQKRTQVTSNNSNENKKLHDKKKSKTKSLSPSKQANSGKQSSKTTSVNKNGKKGKSSKRTSTESSSIEA